MGQQRLESGNFLTRLVPGIAAFGHEAEALRCFLAFQIPPAERCLSPFPRLEELIHPFDYAPLRVERRSASVARCKPRHDLRYPSASLRRLAFLRWQNR